MEYFTEGRQETPSPVTKYEHEFSLLFVTHAWVWKRFPQLVQHEK
jgi:hypothetical protein